jgi:hypothetical protein
MCSARMARGLVLQRSGGLECPVCRAELRISGATRIVASIAGLLGGWAAAVWCSKLTPTGAWGFEVLWALAGFAAGSVAGIFVFADLQVRERHGEDVFPQRST